MNKYTTQRKMFKVNIIQVCIKYKMGQLTVEQRMFKMLFMANLNFKGVHFFDTPCSAIPTYFLALFTSN